MQTFLQPELIRRLQGEYLRDQQRYDRWGALGMVLLVEDFRRRNEPTALPKGLGVESLINHAFPGTFQQHEASPRNVNRDSVLACYSELMLNFMAEGMDAMAASGHAAAETASRFSVSAELVNSYLI